MGIGNPMRCLILMCFLAACGNPQTPSTPEMDGSWTGQATISIVGEDPRVLPWETRAISVADGSQFTLCGTAWGFVTGVYDGGGMRWHGSITCPPLTLSPTCPMSITYTDAVASMYGAGGLAVQATGTATRCNETTPATYAFDGVRDMSL